MEAVGGEREIAVLQVVLGLRGLLEGDQQEVVAAVADRLDAGVVVAEVAGGGAVVEGGAEFGAQVAGVEDQGDREVEAVGRTRGESTESANDDDFDRDFGTARQLFVAGQEEVGA